VSRLSRNIAYNLLGQTLALALSLAATRVIVTRLGGDALGIISFSVTMSAVVFAVLEMGICSTAVREVAAHTLSDPGYVRDLIRTASLAYWAACALLAGGVYAASPLLVERWITLSTMDASTAVQLVRILGIGGLAVLPRSLYASLLRGVQRMEYPNAIDVSLIALQQGGTIALLSAGASALPIASWIATCNTLGVLAYAGVSARFFSMRALIPGYAPRVVRRNIGFSAKVMSISLLSLVHTQTDKVTLSKMLPVGALGSYSVVYGLAARASILSEAIAQAAFPSFSALLGERDRRGLVRQYWKLQDLVCLAAVPAFAAIVLYADRVLAFVFGAEAGRALVLPAALLCAGFYMHGTLIVPYLVSLAAGKPEISARANLWAVCVSVPATVVLIARFGLAGAGASWVAYQAFLYAVAVPAICAECLRIPATAWYAHTGRIAAAAVVTYGSAWGILQALGATSVLAVTAAYVGATLAFAGEARWLMGGDLRGTLTRFFRAGRVEANEAA
jgi:O-antigen/teichoic acid export membrane protein